MAIIIDMIGFSFYRNLCYITAGIYLQKIVFDGGLTSLKYLGHQMKS